MTRSRAWLTAPLVCFVGMGVMHAQAPSERSARQLLDAVPPITQVSGDRTAVDEFADEWLRANPGVSTTVAMSQRLYRLGDLVDPGTPGKPRVASTADREMLIEWRRGFVAENPGLPSGDLDRAVDRMLTYGGLTLWTVDGSPVSVASLTRPVGGMVRVGSVYTPPELRRRGKAVFAVTHDDRWFWVADRLLGLENGKLYSVRSSEGDELARAQGG